jgi:charged multivesicular body protein 4
MNSINEQRDIANEISDAISNPANAGLQFDEVRILHAKAGGRAYGLLEFDGLQEELKAELGELEQEDLNERLLGADHVPVHTPAGPSRVEARPAAAQESEDAELEALQAALAMS